MSSNILRNLPEISQTGRARDTVEYTFEQDVDVYRIERGPALRVFGVSSGTTLYEEGTDYETVENADGDIRAIDWSIGGDSPSAGQTFTVDQEYVSIMARFLGTHDEEFDRLSDDLDEIVTIRQIDNAEKGELDRIGDLFGELGERRGRNDSDYRVYLSGIVDSFNGRGTKRGLKFAIASAIGAELDNIAINENFEELSYTIQIKDVNTEFISSAINDLAELADPSVVELAEAIIVIEGDTVTINETGTSVVADTTGLGGETLTLDGNNTLG